ncbi:hypothetical protein TWF281_001685 [Arthrobotrys megalospora]
MPLPPNLPSSVPRLLKASRIPLPSSDKSTPKLSKSGSHSLASALSSPLTLTPTSNINDYATLAVKLRAKLHAISPRRPTRVSSLAQGISEVLEPVVEDSFLGKPIEVPSTTALEADHDQDFHSQSTTLVENESPRPQSAVVFSSEPPAIEAASNRSSKCKKFLKHPFRVDKLRLFLKNTRIGWRSTIPMLQMSPRVVVLDVLMQGQQMAVSYALREEIFAVEQQKEKEDMPREAIAGGIEEKLKRAKAIAMDANTDEGIKISALEEVLNEVEVSGGGLDDWLLDEIEGVSAVYGELLGVDDIDMDLILRNDKIRTQHLNKLEGEEEEYG